jgi:NADH dehydrogenase
LYLRDHVLQQLELADASDDPDERQARCTFVVVGAGYVGTEFTAQMQHFTRKALLNYPRLEPRDLRWMLLDKSPRVLPELGERLGETALGLLRRRGVEIRLQTTVVEANEESLSLSDGTSVPTRTLVWCAGVAASPLVATLGLPLEKGRLVVSERLTVPGRPDVFALGDSAAVPDLTRPGEVTPPTAQHATRQGKTADAVCSKLGVDQPCATATTEIAPAPARGARGGFPDEGGGILGDPRGLPSAPTAGGGSVSQSPAKGGAMS